MKTISPWIRRWAFVVLAVVLFAAGATRCFALSLTGTAAVALKDASGNNVPSGSLALLIFDSNGDGWLNASKKGGITRGGALSATDDPQVLIADAGITTGGTFGGERILEA